MKTLIKLYLLLIGLLFMNINAQNFPKEGDNIRNPHLDKFVGTWVWSNGNDNFTLILKKDNIKFIPTMNLYGDILYGVHKYVKNGKVIENFIQYKDASYNDKKWSLFGGRVGGQNSSTKIELSVRPPVKNQRRLYANIEYIDERHIKIKDIKITEWIYIRREGDPPADYSRTLPSNIILTKQ